MRNFSQLIEISMMFDKLKLKVQSTEQYVYQNRDGEIIDLYLCLYEETLEKT